MRKSLWFVVISNGRFTTRETYLTFAGAAARAAWILDAIDDDLYGVPNAAVTVVEV